MASSLSRRRNRIQFFVVVVLAMLLLNTLYLSSRLLSEDVSEHHLERNLEKNLDKAKPFDWHEAVVKKRAEKEAEKQRERERAAQERRKKLPDRSLLNCSRFIGGPFDVESLEEMVYWKEIPEDWSYRSKFPSREERFLTFDTDLSGFNNQRMVFEINLAVAILTGRTLVLPRDRLIDHIHHDNSKFNMEDFFDLYQIAAKMPAALKLMTTDEFVQQEGGPDRLDIPTNFTAFRDRYKSPDFNASVASHHDRFLIANHEHVRCTHGRDRCSNYTDWIDLRHVKDQMYMSYFFDEYFYRHPKVVCPPYGVTECALGIPGRTSTSTTTTNNNTTNATNDAEPLRARVQAWMKDAEKGPKRYHRLVGHPHNVNEPFESRLEEIFQNRRGICSYDSKLQSAKYYHMRDDPKPNYRLMGHFYDYLVPEDWKEDLWLKRFMRDQLRYNDQLQCAAARIVAAIKEVSRETYHHEDGRFHSIHLRRTDLIGAYKNFDVERSPQQIIRAVTNETRFNDGEPIVPSDSVVYIATDEKDKKFFELFRERYPRVFFLNDFSELLVGIPKEYYGMIDQLVASRGKHFVGTYYSTFTGYINRLRGYHSQKHASENTVEAYEARTQGIIPSWFVSPADLEMTYRHYEPIRSTFFEIEYAMAWRNIDYDVDKDLRKAIKRDETIGAAVKANQRKVNGLVWDTTEAPKETQAAAATDAKEETQAATVFE